MVKHTLEDMQESARLKGGKCLSKEYWDLHTPLEWKCSEGHIWEATPYIINQGGWCPQCYIKGQKLEELQEIAESRGGKCLSQKYINSVTKLQWECKEGHRWHTIPTVIKSGHWCPYCAGLAKLTIEQMRAVAKSRGGKCLSKKYINVHTSLEWECKEGHRWKSEPNSVKNDGQWCPYCAGKAPLTIEQMYALARSRGGKCLSKTYITNREKLEWQCKEGHRWKSSGHSVKSGSWCPYCAKNVRLTIEEMQSLAKSRGGKCLSTKYVNSQTKLLWQCREGHQWWSAPGIVKSARHHWCPYCSNNARLTIEQMRSIARSRGGKCLSDKYVNSQTKLQWECNKGHRWESTPGTIKNGSWCPFCAHKVPLTIEEMHVTAQRRGGKCLSKKYVDTQTKLLWECKEGHRWSAKPNTIRNGSWCPYCAQQVKHTIADMRALAKSYGGKCLSKEYINNKIKLEWECKNGHRWKRRPIYVQRGRWCRKCAGIERTQKVRASYAH